ncbi:VOC family protein [Streptomyces sp. NPDC005167]
MLVPAIGPRSADGSCGGVAGNMFDPSRSGLDHVALTVQDKDELSAWIERLDVLGVEHSPVHRFGPSAFISLQDPDGIQTELRSSGGAQGPRPGARQRHRRSPRAGVGQAQGRRGHGVLVHPRHLACAAPRRMQWR